MFTIGAVGRCLSRALVEGKRLVPKCRSLVLVAAPKDARSYFDHPESTSALINKIAQVRVDLRRSSVWGGKAGCGRLWQAPLMVLASP